MLLFSEHRGGERPDSTGFSPNAAHLILSYNNYYVKLQLSGHCSSPTLPTYEPCMFTITMRAKLQREPDHNASYIRCVYYHDASYITGVPIYGAILSHANHLYGGGVAISRFPFLQSQWWGAFYIIK